MSRVVVIGGANTDVVGVSADPLIAADSNPGVVRFSAGGVARNIAENLARLGEQVELVTALGDDHAARMLASSCRDAGIGLEHSITVAGTPGSVYLAVIDSGGDLVAAVSDMRALDALTPSAIERALEGMPAPDALVFDTNISAEAIVAACGWTPGIPVFADCVSVAKAPRIRESLAHVSALHVNALEAETLTGVAVRDTADGASRASEHLHRLGVERVYITDGPRGVYYSSAEESGRIAAPRVGVENVTGAGDAFMAGVVWGTLQEMPVSAAARTGVAAAAITLRSPSTVSPGIDAGAVSALAEEIAR